MLLANLQNATQGLLARKKQLEQTNTSLEAILRKRKICKMAEDKACAVLENLESHSKV